MKFVLEGRQMVVSCVRLLNVSGLIQQGFDSLAFRYEKLH